ncbi:hypothetical protein SEA_OTTAWA_15 [Arthrobacter phage Ottawa]|nr:hypothetical protein SEA_KHARCHO_15 [Arthrobacter phage Kharcho]WIC89247.1 hypothetical protein SEA_OTTAWA_15 [Arthrobacter phage Ottawa]
MRNRLRRFWLSLRWPRLRFRIDIDDLFDLD